MSFVGHLTTRIYRATIWAFATMSIFGAISWAIPRDVIDIEIIVPNDTYERGGAIHTTNHVQTYSNARSYYDSALVCRNGIERRYNLVQIVVQTEKNNQSVSGFTYTIPEYVMPEENCVIAIDSSHVVEIMPYLTRTYINHFESNAFEVE